MLKNLNSLVVKTVQKSATDFTTVYNLFPLKGTIRLRKYNNNLTLDGKKFGNCVNFALLLNSVNNEGESSELELINTKLKLLASVMLNRTKIIRKPTGFIESDVSVVKFDVKTTSGENGEKIFDAEIQSRNVKEGFSIQLFDCNRSRLLSLMYLEVNPHAKGLILRINAPPNNLIGSVYEIPGISKLVIIEKKNSHVLFQLLTNGGFGWSTSAKILNLEGDKKLGEIYYVKDDSSSKISITFPLHLETANKLLIIGTSLILIKDY